MISIQKYLFTNFDSIFSEDTPDWVEEAYLNNILFKKNKSVFLKTPKEILLIQKGDYIIKIEKDDSRFYKKF
jgi:hypothetical protein